MYWLDFDYEVLHDHIMTRKRRGKGDSVPYNDIIIMADTETSKKPDERVIMPEYDIINKWFNSGSGISVSQAIKQSIPDYKEFEKELRQYIRVSKNGVPVDIAYMELSSLFPWVFPEDIINAEEQLIQMLDVMEELTPPEKNIENHVCLWTISLRAYHKNIVTLYGFKPSNMIECMTKIHESMPGKRTVFYFHNWAYDKVFLQKFMYQKWGFPKKC